VTLTRKKVGTMGWLVGCSTRLERAEGGEGDRLLGMDSKGGEGKVRRELGWGAGVESDIGRG